VALRSATTVVGLMIALFALLVIPQAPTAKAQAVASPEAQLAEPREDLTTVAPRDGIIRRPFDCVTNKFGWADCDDWTIPKGQTLRVYLDSSGGDNRMDFRVLNYNGRRQIGFKAEMRPGDKAKILWKNTSSTNRRVIIQIASPAVVKVRGKGHFSQ
jgi:hypothetical protein